MSEQMTSPGRLSPADLARLLACRERLERAEAEHRAAEAEHRLLLIDLRSYRLGPGDKIDPRTGQIMRAEMEAPAENGVAKPAQVSA